MDYSYPKVGAFYHGGEKTSFCVWAPLCAKVDVVSGDQSFLMRKDERGYWHATLDSVSAGATYQFSLDGTDPLPDPASLSQPTGVHGPSKVADRRFAWTDAHWRGMALEELILYEVHTGTFTRQGDFDGVRSKLRYLKEIGVNAIELMPVAQFPGGRNWGYDGVYPFAVQNSYGGINALKKLVDEAHREGLAVILDVVYNHLGPEGNYLARYGPYFTDKYRSFWGKALNYDDAWCDGVRNFFWQNALMWLDEFHIDGLRLDAVHAIHDVSAVHFIAGLTRRVRALEKESGRRKVLIAEIDLNNPTYITSAAHGGYGLDAQWIDEFHHALRALITGETEGYYEDFGTAAHLRKALTDSYVYTGEYSVHRKKHFGTSAAEHPYHQFVVFGQNHDQVGNRLLGDRLSTRLSFEGLKLLAATILLSPHVPMLFMGEEYGERNPFQYFISHTDETLVQQVREGRKQEFAYFKWEGDVPDPQSQHTFDQCVLSWRQDEEARTMLLYYKALIDFRKRRPAMKGNDRSGVNVYPGDNKVVAFERSYSGDRVLIVLNFEKEVVTYNLPASVPKLFDSASPEWNGPGTGITGISTGRVSLFPESAVVFAL